MPNRGTYSVSESSRVNMTGRSFIGYTTLIIAAVSFLVKLEITVSSHSDSIAALNTSVSALKADQDKGFSDVLRAVRHQEQEDRR